MDDYDAPLTQYVNFVGLEAVQSVLDKLGRAFGGRDVGLDDDGFAAGMLDLLFDLEGLGLGRGRNIVDGDAGAVAGEGQGSGSPDTGFSAGASDDGNLALERQRVDHGGLDQVARG